MRITRFLPVCTLCFFVVAACATVDRGERQVKPNAAAIARALGCGPDEIAFCVDTDCAPADYYCADKNEVLGTIW